jgi:hypothetical protein
LNDVEAKWVKELKRRMDTEISTVIHTSNFIQFFKHHKEKTASSPSGRHMGHYKVIAKLADTYS